MYIYVWIFKEVREIDYTVSRVRCEKAAMNFTLLKSGTSL